MGMGMSMSMGICIALLVGADAHGWAAPRMTCEQPPTIMRLCHGECEHRADTAVTTAEAAERRTTKYCNMQVNHATPYSTVALHLGLHANRPACICTVGGTTYR